MFDFICDKNLRKEIDDLLDLNVKMFQLIREIHTREFNSYANINNQQVVITEENEFEEEITNKDLQYRLNLVIDVDNLVKKLDEDYIESINDKLNTIIISDKYIQSVELSIKTLDKFDYYMKNVDKLNNLMNEFKGCVSMARGALQDRKDYDSLMKDFQTMLQYTKQCREEAILSLNESRKNTEYAKTLHNQHFKIEAIYKILSEKEYVKKKTTRKKKNLPLSE